LQVLYHKSLIHRHYTRKQVSLNATLSKSGLKNLGLILEKSFLGF